MVCTACTDNNHQKRNKCDSFSESCRCISQYIKEPRKQDSKEKRKTMLKVLTASLRLSKLYKENNDVDLYKELQSGKDFIIYYFRGPRKGDLIYHDPRFPGPSPGTAIPGKPITDPENLVEYRSFNGLLSAQKWFKVVSCQKFGWVSYYWTDDNTSIYPKYTFITQIPGTDLLIGAGFLDKTSEGIFEALHSR